MKLKTAISKLFSFIALLVIATMFSCEKEAINNEPVVTATKPESEQGVDASSEVSLRSESRIRKHAPYLYLAKNGSTGYDMYIIVPVNDGEKIAAGSFVSTENSTVKQLDITVVADPSEHQENAVMHKTFSTEAASFELAVVNVDNPGSIDYSGKIRLEDAGEDNVTDEGGLAYSRPYAYLARNTAGQFVPYLLLPLKADKTATDNAPSGNVDCFQQITITSQSPATQDRIVLDLQINGKEFLYIDDNPLVSSGKFEVETVEGEANELRKKRKTIIRDKDADDK